MRTEVKSFHVLRWLAIGMLVSWLVVFPAAMWVYDSRSRAEWLGTLSSELPDGADIGAIELFLARHNADVGFDEIQRQIVGAMPQTALDRCLLNRQVLVVFNLNTARRLEFAEVRIHYNFL